MPFDVGYVGGKYVAVRKLSDDPSPLFWEIVSIDGEAVDSRLGKREICRSADRNSQKNSAGRRIVSFA